MRMFPSKGRRSRFSAPRSAIPRSARVSSRSASAITGGADYKPSTAADGTVTIDKASVKVHVKSASMYVSEAANGLDLVTTDPVDNFDTYVIYAGLTSNVTTALYVQLPARYTSNSTLLAIVDKALAAIASLR